MSENTNRPISISSFAKPILHIDCDSFFTSVEQAMHPEFKGKPVVTGKERGIVACASYEAKGIGKITSDHMKGLREIKKDHPKLKKRIIVWLEKTPRLTEDDIEILPYKVFVKKLWAGELISS